ncbi:geranylgeranyl transferase type-1 subunit beta [Sporothrix bragantina]|uniref:Geranylgeranyl transferase type-1 subunit beta n=1 Tax=Sporothrix bragantina TaxID=671064 RepID=A0ABP0ATT4_9PEZI
MSSDDSPLDNARHLRYWQRCLRTLLPHQYTANDSTRMMLGCFCVAATDVLSTQKGAEPVISARDRKAFRAWVLACQHPGGGFVGGPTHAYPRAVYAGFDFGGGSVDTGAPGEANIAATLFALQLLALLANPADGERSEDKKSEDQKREGAFLGVNRDATLRWLRRLQRPDGSFGEYVADVPDARAAGGRRPVVGGGADMRYCYIAAMIRWMLGGGVDTSVPDINVDALVLYMRRGQTYDGGFAESSTHESHAGYAFCAIAALELLGRPAEGDPATALSSSENGRDLFARGIADVPALLRWLAARTFLYRPEIEEDDDAEWQESIVTEVTPLEVCGNSPLLGFNGRCNKHADSCYTWWTVSSLNILERHGYGYGLKDKESKDNWAAKRRFLLEKMQHHIGGFSKVPGGPPDIYHAYLSLAALASQGESSLKAFDPAMSVSLDTVRTIEAARRGLLRGQGEGGQKRRANLLSLGKACWGETIAIKA